MVETPDPLEMLRNEHRKLLRVWRDAKPDPSTNVTLRVKRFIARVQAMGAVIEGDGARDHAQSILDHWITQLALVSPDFSTDDLPVLLDSFRGPGSVPLSAYEEDGDLTEGPELHSFTKKHDAIGGTAALDEEPTLFSSIAQMYRNLLGLPLYARARDEDPAQKARERLRLGALARQWEDSNRDPGYLLNGYAVDRGWRFKGDTQLDEFIDASRRYESARTRAKNLVILALAGLAVTAIYAGFVAEHQRGLANQQRVLAEYAVERERLVAERVSLQAQQTAIAEYIASVAELRANALVAAVEMAPRSHELSAALTEFKNSVSTDEIKVRPELTGSTLRGSIWLGTPQDPKAVTADGTALNFRTIKRGTEIRANVTLALRATMPRDDGTLATSIGVVPKGWQATATGRAEVKGRQQYFVMVDNILPPTTVYLQFTGESSREAAENLRKYLKAQSYDVPSAEPMKFGIESSVKYDTDCATQGEDLKGKAIRLAEQATGYLKAQNLQVTFKLKPINNNCKPKNTLELWVAFDNPDSPARPTRERPAGLRQLLPPKPQ